MMKIIGAILVCLSLSLVSGFICAGTIWVDEDNIAGPWDGTPDHPYAVIQDGIDAAVDDDMVLVEDGLYVGSGNMDIDFKGKAITLTSENGAESTVIDCKEVGRGFYFHSGETSLSIVRGFTIENGCPFDGYGGGICCVNSSPTIEENIVTECSASFGGGIYCNNSSPIIENNEISVNTAGSDGGGIYCTNGSSPTIRSNMITHNSSDGGDGGGGICCFDFPLYHTAAKVENNEISGNSARRSGGGIRCFHSSPEIVGNVINGNSACDYGGGGIFCNSSYSTIVNNTISGNSAGREGGGICSVGGSTGTMIINNTISGNSAGEGGGIYCYRADPVMKIEGNEISANLTVGRGGGIFCGEFSPTIESNKIKKNSADMGGGIYCEDFHSSIENNEISGNSTTGSGGGIYLTDSCPRVVSNTFTGNSAGSRGGGISCWDSSSPQVLNVILWSDSPDEVFADAISLINITYSDVKGSWEGMGNINADPLFIGAHNENYHLMGSSPCIGAGIMTQDVPSADLEDNIRPNPPNSNPDMGAYETSLAEPAPSCIVQLAQGWNLISLPLQPSDAAPGAVLVSIHTKYNSVWAFDLDTSWSIYAPGAPSDLEEMIPGRGYWIKMDETGTLIIEGTIPVQTAISLIGNAWNLVGYSSLEFRNAEECMSNVAGDINSVWEYGPHDTVVKSWSVYAPGGPSDLQIMKPGYGYWIKADRRCEWNINAP